MANHLGGNLMFTARLNGAQQVPAITTTANGVAGFTFNENRDSLWLNVNLTGLSGAITGIHIHEAALGVNGPVIVDLATYLTGTTVKGVLTGSAITKAFISKMLQGAYYLNVHTAANAGGEIRGQIMLETDWAFTANLTGAQQVPPVTTTAQGLATFNLSKHDGVLKFNAVVDGLSGAITGVHLHSGAIGASGSVVLDLMPFLSGNTISGQADPTTFLAALKSGGIYINVHTAANPGGEIRGQLMLTNGVNFDADFTGSQQVPPITTNARAVASVKLNTTFDTLFYDVMSNGLSGAITSAHFHNGELGVAGGVAVDIGSGINGKRITGFVTGTSLTNTLIVNLLSGKNYINLHTAANAGGEIRGQVYKVAREGYNIMMDGLQQVPVVVSIAKGGGIVTIDRDRTNVHYMLAVSNITMTSSHFHAGAKGQSGPVVYALTFTDNGSYGYWKSTDMTPFTSTVARQFAGDSIYVNIHTALNAGGEIRGQVTRDNSAKSSVGITKKQVMTSNVELYPNPVVSTLYLNGVYEFKIIDRLGRTVIESMKAEKVDISALPSGVYNILIMEDGIMKSKSFLKN